MERTTGIVLWIQRVSLLVLVFWISNVKAHILNGVSFSNNVQPQIRNWPLESDDLSLVYSNEQVAFYMEQTNYTSHALSFISSVWNYANTTYGPFGSMRHVVHIRIGEKWGYCKVQFVNSLLQKMTRPENIDCLLFTAFKDPKDPLPPYVPFILKAVAEIVLRIAKNTQDKHIWMDSQMNKMSDIIIYDLMLEMGLKNFADFWVSLNIRENQAQDNKTAERTYMFRDWFYPIYMYYGGTSVLSKFFGQLHLYSYPPGVKILKRGEFIHFWSGAAGEDLSVLAIPAFHWKNPEDNSTLVKARRSFSQIHYSAAFPSSHWNQPQGARKENWSDHKEELMLVYSDDHTVFYFDKDMNDSISWPFKLLSNAWEYTKGKYGPLGNDPLLYVVLHGKKHPNCVSLQRGMKRNVTFQHMIDCGPLTDSNDVDNWSDNVLNAYLLVDQISRIIIEANEVEDGIWRYYDSDSGSSLRAIFSIDILQSSGRTNGEIVWLKKRLSSIYFIRNLDSPIKVFLFRDWYLNIYENYGGAEAIHNFTWQLRQPWREIFSLKIQLGEFVHFWSAAAQLNLWHLATKAFGWTTQDHKQFIQAKSDYPRYNYSDTFPHTTMAIPQLEWKENWMQGRRQHDKALTLVYVDSYVAFYFDPTVAKSVSWPFKPISAGWQWALEQYGPFGPDPILYVILHEDPNMSWCYGSRAESFSDPDFQNRTVIDCTMAYGEWTNSVEYFDVLMEQLAERITSGAKGIGTWPVVDILTSSGITNILIFDIYMGIGKINEAVRFLRVIRGKDSWFKKWHYKIYAKYGRTSVLSRFFSLLQSYWPRSPNGYDYAKKLNAGEFIHFWSGAAGVNLTFMIPEALKLNKQQEMEYQNATVDYSMITYRASTDQDEDTAPLTLTENWFGHSEYLFRAYSDSFVVTYFDADVPQNITWPFNLLSRSWSYLQKSYDLIPQTSHASLHIVLHAKRHNLCRTLWNTPSKSNNVTNIIDCGLSSSESWVTASADNVDYLMQEFGHIVQQSANLTDEKENYVSSLTDVMVFDIYLSTGRIEDAHRWFVTKINEKETQSAGEIYWIRDWYIPIYTGYGGVSVLNSYSELVFKYGSIKKDDGAKLSIGQILHFWSASSGNNLLPLADKALSWTERYQLQFGKARKQSPGFTYKDYHYSLPGPGKHDDNLTLLAIVIVFAVLLLIMVLTLCLLHRRRIKRLQEQIRELNVGELVDFFEGMTNPAHSDGNVSSESRPFNMDFEIQRDRLDIYYDHVLGSGEFGLVVRGSITTKFDDETQVTTVAVKTVKPNADVTLFKSLLSELKILCYLDNKDENVARLMGAVTMNIKQRELFIALEFCEQGDLRSYLKQRRSNFRDLFRKKEVCVTSFSKTNALTTTPADDSQPKASSGDSKTETISRNYVSTLDLLEWARQISSGMAFISSQNIIHGDLAARNILLTGECVAKISDFGLSRQLANYSCYTKKSKAPLPWKWLAIESLLDMNFSVQSDVWAFGVTLYEIFSLGQTPYPGCKWNKDFVDRLVAGDRVQSPVFGNEQVYGIIMDCMKKKPEERIAFADITEKFKNIKAGLRPTSESDSCCIYSVFEC